MRPTHQRLRNTVNPSVNVGRNGSLPLLHRRLSGNHEPTSVTVIVFGVWAVTSDPSGWFSLYVCAAVQSASASGAEAF
jgi:hypothetical protein